MNFILIKSQRLQVLTIYPVNALHCQACLPPVLTLPGDVWKSDIRSFLDHQTSLSDSIISLWVSRNTECLGLWEPIYLGCTERVIMRQYLHSTVKMTWRARRGDWGHFLVWMKKRGIRWKTTVSRCLDLTLAHELSKGICCNLKASMSFSHPQT